MAEKKSKILIILGIIAGIIFLSYAIYMLSLSISVRRRIARLSAAGYPVSLAEYMDQRPSSPEADQNALDLCNAMERISNVYNTMNQELWDKYEQDGIKFWGGHEFDDPGSVEIQGRYVMDNFELLLEAREILKRPELLYPPSTMPINNIEHYVAHRINLIRTSSFQRTAVQYLVHSGRHDEAFLVAEDMLRLAESLDKTLLPIPSAGILLHLLLNAQDALLMWEGIPTEELERMQAILLRAEDTLKVHNHSFLGLIELTDIFQSSEYRKWHRVYSGILYVEMIFHLDYVERMMDIEDMPIHDRMNHIRDFESQLTGPPRLIQSYYDTFEPPDFSILPIYALTSDIETLSSMRNARTAIATELFRRVNGRWPDNLQELVPDFLDEIPIDPFDGMPLRYRHMKDGEELRAEYPGIVARNGVIIYSIGPDGSDDGGAIDSYVNFIVFSEGKSGDDIVFPLGDIERIDTR
jgi:hypothetical protein